MGMFDYLNCKASLPAGVPDLRWQTKSLRCAMDTYEIREDGTLWGEDYETEDRSDPNAEGLSRLIGCITRVNIRPRQLTDYTGEVCFYEQDGNKGWWEFSAYFVKGQLKHLELIESPTTGADHDGHR